MVFLLNSDESTVTGNMQDPDDPGEWAFNFNDSLYIILGAFAAIAIAYFGYVYLLRRRNSIND